MTKSSHPVVAYVCVGYWPMTTYGDEEVDSRFFFEFAEAIARKVWLERHSELGWYVKELRLGTAQN